MHLNNVTAKINEVKFNTAVLSLKSNEDYTLVYDLNKGKKIPISVYNTLVTLFNNYSYLTEDVTINVEVLFNGKICNIIWEDNRLSCPEQLTFLFSDNNYFNFFTSIHEVNTNLELFEKLFKFIIKKELSSETESLFKVQFDKYYAGVRQDNVPDKEISNVETEILIERLLKTKNEIFSRINKLTHSSTNLVEEKDKLTDYAQNKEKYTIKYDNLKHDYLMLVEQSKTYFRNVTDLKKIIEQISHELNDVQIHLEMSNLPAAEKDKMLDDRDFLLEKKASFVAALVEAEANLASMSGLISSTKANMEAIYENMDLINHTALEDTGSYDSEVGKMKKEIEDLYLQSSDIDIELNKLQKESSNFNISREYAELNNKGTDEIVYNSLKTSLNTPMLPQSINAVYKYLLNLFMYHCEIRESKGIVSTPILAELNIYPQTFFSKYSKDEVIIG
jgi:hypothetical protein